MCLIDINTGFRTIREAMEELVGPVSRTILYNAGFGCGRTFTRRALRDRLCEAMDAAFAFSVECYSVAGFGSFQVDEVDARGTRAVVRCRNPPTFEAYPFLHSRTRIDRPVCDYSRGVLAGFMAAASGRSDLLASETSCRAMGNPECVFLIGEEREMLQKELSKGSEPPQP
jgi:predicted hydrocarbon binding protein